MDPPTPYAPPTTRAAGWLLLAAILLSVAHGLGGVASALLPGAAFWLAGLLLARRVRGLPRLQALAMLLVGAAGLLYGTSGDGSGHLLKAFSTNQALLAMLAGVTFLRLISLPEVDAGEPDPRGRRALWRTLLGVHLFGSVINLSAVMILGDRQSRRRPLTALQAVVLSRGFALAAHWSPFFAAMGIALGNAPGARLPVLSSVGLPLALLGLLLSGWQLGRRTDAAAYLGYPMHFAALWVPGLLALGVLGTHQLRPEIPVLTLISGLAVLLTVVVLLLRTPARAAPRLLSHVGQGLPGMSGELVLFLAAGVFAAGIGAVVEAGGWQLAITHFGATEAGLLLCLMVALSVVGVHPVISIATAAGLLAPLAPDPDLLGITFLMTWAAGVSVSPLSGMHLGMQGRFGLDPRLFLRWNGPYNLLMLAIYVAALHLFEWWRG